MSFPFLACRDDVADAETGLSPANAGIKFLDRRVGSVEDQTWKSRSARFGDPGDHRHPLSRRVLCVRGEIEWLNP